MPSREIRNSVLMESHTPAIERHHGKLWFVMCGDNDFIGYWDEDNFSDDMGWEADEIARVVNMKKGDTFQHFSSSMHLIICVKD